jgi:hypothetical protein
LATIDPPRTTAPPRVCETSTWTSASVDPQRQLDLAPSAEVEGVLGEHLTFAAMECSPSTPSWRGP